MTPTDAVSGIKYKLQMGQPLPDKLTIEIGDDSLAFLWDYDGVNPWYDTVTDSGTVIEMFVLAKKPWYIWQPGSSARYFFGSAEIEEFDSATAADSMLLMLAYDAF